MDWRRLLDYLEQTTGQVLHRDLAAVGPDRLADIAPRPAWNGPLRLLDNAGPWQATGSPARMYVRLSAAGSSIRLKRC